MNGLKANNFMFPSLAANCKYLNTRDFNFATIKEKRQGSSEKGEREKRSEKKRHWEKGPGTLV